MESKEYGKICSFFGHSQVEKDIYKRVEEIVENLVLKGVNVFFFGGLGEFDDICYRVVSELKKKYTFIRRVFCLTDERYLKKDKREI